MISKKRFLQYGVKQKHVIVVYDYCKGMMTLHHQTFKIFEKVLYICMTNIPDIDDRAETVHACVKTRNFEPPPP